MRVEIDQSGKIEETGKLTIVAFANGRVKILKISSSEKRKLLSTLRELDHPRKTFIYKAFSALIFLLLASGDVREVLVDNEYPGHEATIKDWVLKLFRKKGKRPPQIYIGFVGKESPAHKAAIAAYRGKLKPDRIVKADDVTRLLLPNKTGWRPRPRRDRP